MNLDELARAALAGDLRAKDELARYLDSGLRRYFCARWATDVADDLVQRTFVAMLESSAQFEPRGENAFVRWVYGIAKMQNRAKRRVDAIAAVRAKKLAMVAKTPARGLSSFIMLMESVDMLDQQIEQLTAAQQQAVAGFLRKQRGGALGPNHSAVRLYRARQKLRRGLAASMTTPERAPEPAPARVNTPPAT